MDGITIDIRGICFKMILVEGGNYVMGATPVQHGDAWENEFPVHAVELDSYYIGQTTVTQALWNVVMGLNEDNPSDPTPMVGKSWNEWQTFLLKLNELTERQFRMPTEAEWEIAARGGNEGKGFRYAGSNHLNDVAWFDLNSGHHLHHVMQKQPNELGLYDMSGNVWEWCADWYGKYGDAKEAQPKGPASGTEKVCRGGSYSSYDRICRITCRMSMTPDGKDYSKVGLRLVLDESEGLKGNLSIMLPEAQEEVNAVAAPIADELSQGEDLYEEYAEKLDTEESEDIENTNADDEKEVDAIAVEEPVPIEEQHMPQKKKKPVWIWFLVLAVLVVSGVIWLVMATSLTNKDEMVFKVGDARFSMKLVEGGSFQMGAPNSDTEAKDWEKPVHKVTLDDYYIGETEVTQELYMAVMGYNPSKIVGDNYPVNCVSWDDCFNFCMELRKITGQSFRIPTEAEWEYAARGGSKSKGYRFSGSNNLDEVSWNIGNSDSTAHPVKMKRPNELGIYDMTGNAWEICHDLYARYEGYDETNPRGPQYSEKGGHVRRGGGWLNRGNYSRITYRYFTKFGQKNDFLSFRLAMEAK